MTSIKVYEICEIRELCKNSSEKVLVPSNKVFDSEVQAEEYLMDRMYIDKYEEYVIIAKYVNREEYDRYYR